MLRDITLIKGKIIFIIANELAIKKKKRYIHSDLNRCFPGDKKGNNEEKIAAKLIQKLKMCDDVIDIHSTTAKTKNFIITTKKDNKTRQLIKSLNIVHVVFMEKQIAKQRALIDYVQGVSLECNKDTSAEMVKENILNILKYKGYINGYAKKVEQEWYSCYGMQYKTKKKYLLKNFKKIRIQKESFYPILYKETEYKEILCLKAKKRRNPDLNRDALAGQAH